MYAIFNFYRELFDFLMFMDKSTPLFRKFINFMKILKPDYKVGEK